MNVENKFLRQKNLIFSLLKRLHLRSVIISSSFSSTYVHSVHDRPYRGQSSTLWTVMDGRERKTQSFRYLFSNNRATKSPHYNDRFFFVSSLQGSQLKFERIWSKNRPIFFQILAFEKSKLIMTFCSKLNPIIQFHHLFPIKCTISADLLPFLRSGSW